MVFITNCWYHQLTVKLINNQYSRQSKAICHLTVTAVQTQYYEESQPSLSGYCLTKPYLVNMAEVPDEQGNRLASD
jgi:hypothetical protein